jgi:hypothetical protein
VRSAAQATSHQVLRRIKDACGLGCFTKG